jgi:hypothetical protein
MKWCESFKKKCQVLTLFLNRKKEKTMINVQNLQKQNNPQTKTRQRGNAILFTLLAMVIGGVVVAVGITQYQDADRATSVQGTVAEVNSIIGNTKQNYGQYSYNGLNTAVAVGSRVIPESLHVAPAGAGAAAITANNKFGGGINMVGPSVFAGAVASADLTYLAVPATLCAAIVNGTQGLADAITVNGVVAKPLLGVVNVANLNQGCTGGATVPIIWTFGRS